MNISNARDRKEREGSKQRKIQSGRGGGGGAGGGGAGGGGNVGPEWVLQLPAFHGAYMTT